MTDECNKRGAVAHVLAVIVLLAMTVLAPGVSAQAMPFLAAGQERTDAKGGASVPGSTASLPEARPLVHFGADNLRTDGYITDLAFSPDGKLIAAANANAAHPTLQLFDVLTGSLTKRISLTDERAGAIQCVVFSPDQTLLAWGEFAGHLALWDLTRDRLAWREKVQ